MTNQTFAHFDFQSVHSFIYSSLYNCDFTWFSRK